LSASETGFGILSLLDTVPYKRLSCITLCITVVGVFPIFAFGTFALVIHHGTRLELESALPFFSVDLASAAGSIRLVQMSLPALEEFLDVV
jgi:hypothetical protein